VQKRNNTQNNRKKGGRVSLLRLILGWLTVGLALGVMGLAVLLLYLDVQVVARFSADEKWQVPGKMYARALELHTGALLSPEMLVVELKLLRYQVATSPRRPGTYRAWGQRVEFVTRGFQFWDGTEAQQHVVVDFDQGRVVHLRDERGRSLPIIRVEPPLIGGFFPDHREDRMLIELAQAPEILVDTLILVEDRQFYEHAGVSLRGIFRAFWVNMREGRVAQGGSTLTQQLVKNYFLHSDRTLARKAQEVLMAILLELHYGKAELLEAYLNEVYLGQAGSRAIHGFGLASFHYFGRSLDTISVEQWALLVALVKGPSYYDPRRHPQRAVERRNQVLALMAEAGLLTETQFNQARVQPLGVLKGTENAVNRYPAFTDLVRQQLEQDYDDAELRSDGLLIFTTLDPQVQAVAERAITEGVPVLRQKLIAAGKVAPEDLQAAAVVSSPQSGEVLAVVGGAKVKTTGFNRALESNRPVGSIIKPFVYLTALMQADYDLNTVLSDEPFELRQVNGDVWSPRNFDKKSHGNVILQEALVNSYNQSTARLATNVGMEKVVNVLSKMGLNRRVAPLPAVALGALELSPMAVTQLYQTLAAGGFSSPLRAIRAVMKPNGELVQRYPYAVAQVVPSEVTFEVRHALRSVAERGTARSLQSRWRNAPIIAGKTGTTDELRDSWFAGMGENYLGVIWVGSDRNEPAGLTGAQGALKIWGDIMTDLPLQSMRLHLPERYSYAWLHPETGHVVDAECQNAVRVPIKSDQIRGIPAGCDGEYFDQSEPERRQNRQRFFRLLPWRN
jgi:penicillin-binding protein 1B